MALTQEQVSAWFDANPNATADDVAAAVKSVGGLEANAGLADMIANRYQIGTNQVNDYYNQYTAPTAGLPTSNTVTDQTTVNTNVGGLPTTPTNNITSNANATVATSDWPTITYGTTGTDGDVLTRTTTSDGTPFYLRGEEGGEYQNPATVESYAPFTGQDGKKYYAVYAPTFSSGLEWNQTPITSVLTEAEYKALKGGSSAIGNLINSPVGSFALNLLGPWGQVINSVNAASQGNYTGAILSGLNAAGGFGVTNLGGVDINTAKNIAAGLNAADKGNVIGALTAGANLFGGVSGDFTTAGNLAAAGLSLKNNDTAGFMNALGNLTGSADAKLAAAAISLTNALESGNPNQLQAAWGNFNSTISGSTKSTSTTSTTSTSTTALDSVPLTDEEIADLTEDQLRVYQEGGVSGLRDYNRAIKNLTSLTTSGLTGDSTGGGDTLTTTGGTGALTTTTTGTDFEDSEITRLRGLGYTNAQISAYLENLNNLTASLDSTDTSGLSDFGLAAFRQAKAAGATDIEAMAAANLAISGKYPTNVSTETGTEVELVVTDTTSEPNIYSFYDTQTEFETGTELIVTSGKETGQETESETESETGTLPQIVVTALSETETAPEIVTEVIVTTSSETETESEIVTEIVVTTSSETETESETITEIIVTTASETESETETITEIVVTTASETETETETITEIVVTTASETETETETITEIIVTTSSETETESETITEIIVTTSSETETETETETITKIVTTPVVTKPPTKTSGSFTGGTPATGGMGKPTEFLKENLLKTYMTKQSFKDPLAEFNKARTDMMKENMMQQGVDPRLAAILAAKMNGEEAPKAPTYSYGEEPSSIDDILSLKGEDNQNYAQGGYVQPLMAQGGMALPLLAAKGGLPTMHKGREDFRDGKHVAGEGDGQSDDIPAMLADGEFVFPADVVSALGNGSTKAGTDKLYEMMHSIRDRARSKGAKDLPPPALKSPLDYLKKR